MTISRIAAMLTMCGLLGWVGTVAAQDQPAADAKPAVMAVKIHVLKGEIPQAWVSEEPANAMRTMQYRLPKVEGDPADAEMYVSVFSGAGTLEQNIGRWKARFQNPQGGMPQTSERDGLKIASVTISGTYIQRRGPMDPNATLVPNYKLFGTVIDTPADGTVYIIVTGPAKTMDAHKAGFESLVNSLKP